MSVSYKTPGVYVQEANDKSVSIPSVATSIPAFFGVVQSGGSATPLPVRITNFLEFTQQYGKPASPAWEVTTAGDGFAIAGDPQSQLPTGAALLYYAMQSYFLNGGGACYVVGLLADDIGQYLAGLRALENVDEPTLILPCGAINLSAEDYHTFCKMSLVQAERLRDRFCVVDARMESAALTTSMRVSADMAAFRDGIGGDHLSYGAAYYPYVQSTLAWEYSEEVVKLDGTAVKDITQKATHARVTAWLRGLRVVLPPSAAIAGLYATVDRDRGVWKAPANVGLVGVTAPMLPIDNDEQDDMNVPGDRAQVNAIRSFSGLGTMVWGARTLDFKAADWTYLSVRRLFIMMEESIAKAINVFVFEANDKSTWTAVKGAIDSYLFQLWGKGALAGGKPEESYAVSVGLGETMTADDVREGRMVVTVRVAPVRPAEFIEITFSQNVKSA